MNIIDTILGKKNNDVESVFSDKHSVTAYEAYQKSRFGIVKTDKELVENFFTDVHNLISLKNQERTYCGMVEVGTDIIKFLPKIQDKLMHELGFKVIVLDDNSVVTNSITGKRDTVKTGTTYLLLMWNKQAIEEMAAINAESEKDDTYEDETFEPGAESSEDDAADETPAISGNEIKGNPLNS